MPQFELPFDDYQIGNDLPITIEFHPQGMARYRYLYGNPLYYQHVFRFKGGSLYRSFLGYDTLWDKEAEAELVKSLHSYLSLAEERGIYYLEEMRVTYRFRFHGLLWRRGVKPRLNFRRGNHFECRRLNKGAVIFVRVNLMDTPRHVDIELADGTVLSCSLTRYLQWRNNLERTSKYENKRRSKKAGNDEKDGKSGEAKGSESHGPFTAVSHQPLAAQLHSLRKTFRRPTTLRAV